MLVVVDLVALETKVIWGILTIIIKKTETAHNGETVVALINNEATLKRYYLKDKGVELHPQNPHFNIIHVKATDDFQINGIVLAVFREYA